MKVPVGKHCGFVQFVRKADAERAIEKMQGFPIGGSRIRLSWGRSQCKCISMSHTSAVVHHSPDKAAQAAAQAAQAAALQTNYTAPTLPAGNAMTPDQALHLLYKLSQQGYISPGSSGVTNDANSNTSSAHDTFATSTPSTLGPDVKLRSGPDTPHNVDSFASNAFLPRPDVQRMLSNFSPFSPDPDPFVEESKPRDTPSFARSEALPHPSKAYAPGFYPHQLQTQELKHSSGTPVAGKVSPSGRPSSASRYGAYLDMPDRTISRPDPSSRPLSGQTPMPNSRAEADHNDLEDLNGTLASLDLDRPWKSPEVSGGLSNSYQQATKPPSPK